MYMNFSLNYLDRQKILMIVGFIILLLMFYCKKKSNIENFAGTCQTQYNNVYRPNLNTNIIQCCNSSTSVGFNEVFDAMNLAIESLPNSGVIKNLTLAQITTIAEQSERINSILNNVSSNSKEVAKELSFEAITEIVSKKQNIKTFRNWFWGRNFLSRQSKTSAMAKNISEYETIKTDIVIARLDQFFNPMKEALQELPKASEILPLSLGNLNQISNSKTPVELLVSSLDDSTKPLFMASKLRDLISIASKSEEILAFKNYINAKQVFGDAAINIIYSKKLANKTFIGNFVRRRICVSCCNEKGYGRNRNKNACIRICRRKHS